MSTLKRRTISIDNLSCPSCENTVSDALSRIEGVSEVMVDHERGSVNIAYDVMAVDLAHIEEEIEQSGYTIHDSVLHRIKDSFIRFTEQNERDNRHAPAMPCCSYSESSLENKKQPTA